MYELKSQATELDFLVVAIQKMRDLQNKRHGVIEAQKFENEMANYFRLPVEMTTSFVYDTLLRLSEMPAGSSQLRDTQLLDQLHNLNRGGYFRLQGRLATLVQHHKAQGTKTGGYFVYKFATDFREQTMTYEEAWTLMEEGKLTLGQSI